jgi:hypothetical protein
MEVVISALTIIEAVHGRTDQARLRWILSGVRIVHVGDEEARAASAVLIAAGLHGHKCAIDAAVAEMALRQRRPTVLLTSDIDDMTKLCGDRVRLVAVRHPDPACPAEPAPAAPGSPEPRASDLMNDDGPVQGRDTRRARPPLPPTSGQCWSRGASDARQSLRGHGPSGRRT